MTNSRLIDSVASTTAHRDRDDLDVSIARLLVDFLHAKSVTIHRLLDDDGTVRVACRVRALRMPDRIETDPAGKLSDLPRLDSNPAWQACVNGKTRVEYTADDGHTHHIFPIESEQRVVGLLEFAPRHGLRARDQTMIDALLRIVRNHLSLLDYGECDTLTGLKNRKTFETSFYKLVSRTATAPFTSGESSWLGILDIDRFKSINDTHGHLFGDEVLLLVARLIQKNFRGADQLFRFGGEEFLVILDHASPEGARIAFERLRDAIDKHVFPQIGHVTVSLGYTQINPSDPPATCVDRADAGLYYAKQNGRNQIQRYETLVESGAINPLKSTAADDIELF